MKAPTPEQAHILRHALGLAAPVRRGRPPRRPYRNHYCAPQGHENIPAIEALIALGWMEKAGADTYRVVVPAATHGSFTDGSRYEPRIAPVDGTADHVLTVEREVVDRASVDRPPGLGRPALERRPQPRVVRAELDDRSVEVEQDYLSLVASHSSSRTSLYPMSTMRTQ